MTRFKNDDDRQTERFGFTCTATEAQQIRALAKAHGISQHSVFIRLACLGIIPVDRGKIGVAGTMLPSETKPASQSTPAVADTVPDFIRWVNDKNAVPVLFAWEAEHYETFYDGRVNQWLRILDGKPVDEKPEKKGHVYHKPIIVPIPFDPDSSSLPSELLPLLVRESAIWKHPAFYDFSTRYWKVLTPKLWQKFQILPRNYSAWLKQWWGLASEDGDEDESEDES